MKKTFSLKCVAFLLTLTTLLSIVCMPAAADGTKETLSENTATELEPIETEEQIFTRLTADSLMLDYIDEESFRAAGHVNRLPEEEDLNSYVFENADGTRTAYILAEPVKYVDGTGAVREKNLTLSTGQTPNASVMAASVNTSAYTVTATNTPMTFPNDLSQGVSFTYGEYTITLRPETVSTATTIMQAEGKVLYRNAFGATAHLMYTPQLNGLKEDIVLTRYTDQNTFSFILDTDGLIPASDAGGYYLHDGTDMQIRLGQVVSYDANGDFSIGEMTVEPIGGTNYRVTLTVDEEFLEDAFYPVTVDPSILIDGTDMFEDATIYNVDQNQTMNGERLYVGFLNTQAVRSIIRPIGLYDNSVYSKLQASQINHGYLCLYSGDNKSLDIQLYRNRILGWTESTVSWAELDMYQVSSSKTTLSSSGIKALDITDFIKNWKNSLWSANEGIVLVADNEPSNGNNKSFYSAETQNPPRIVIDYTPTLSILSGGTSYVQIGETCRLSVYSRPENYDVTWQTDDPTIATVDQNGVLTGISEGRVKITVTATVDNNVYSAYRYLYIVPIMSGTYYIQNRETIKFLTIDSGGVGYDHMASGSIMEQWSHSGGNEQRFEITRLSDGYYKIVSVKSGLALSVNSSKLGTPDEALVQYTYSGANYQKWKIIPTENGAFKIKAKSSESYSNDLVMCVGDTLLEETTDGTDIEQRKYETNTSYLDEWYLTMLPLSGSEVAYEPWLWNGTVIQGYTNCYAYALNNQDNYRIPIYVPELVTMQPGISTYCNVFPNVDFQADIYYTKEELYRNVKKDADYFGFSVKEVERFAVCEEGSYKVALVVDNYDDSSIAGRDIDYHWYRQNPDGTWSHKPGQDVVTNLDASGKIIYDPETADRDTVSAGIGDVNYAVFIGYYQVTPMNHMHPNKLNTVDALS